MRSQSYQYLSNGYMIMYICTVIYNTTVLMGTLIVLMVLLPAYCLTGGDYSSCMYIYKALQHKQQSEYVQISGRCMYIYYSIRNFILPYNYDNAC